MGFGGATCLYKAALQAGSEAGKWLAAMNLGHRFHWNLCFHWPLSEYISTLSDSELQNNLRKTRPTFIICFL